MTEPTDQDVGAVLARSMELIAEERDSENEQLLARAIERFPADPHLCLRAAGLALITERSEAAKEHLHRAVRLAPEDPVVLTYAAAHMADLHEDEVTERWVRWAAERAPDEFYLAGRLAYVMSYVLLRQGHLDPARELAIRAFRADPGMPRHGIWLANILEGLGSRDEALAVAEQSLDHSPGYPGLERVRRRLAGDRLDDPPPRYTVSEE